MADGGMLASEALIYCLEGMESLKVVNIPFKIIFAI